MTRIPAKHCSKCGEYKALTEFYRHESGADGRKTVCRACYATDNVARARTRYREFREWLWAEKSKPCTDCGLTWPPYVMQFDHVPGRGPKLFEIATGNASRSRDAVLAEMAKCDLVCANCHAIRTHERRPDSVE